ncbi:Cupin 1, partial [Dillenia turbinata]
KEVDPELKQCKHQCKVQQQFDEEEKQRCEDYIKEKKQREESEKHRSSEPWKKLQECRQRCTLLPWPLQAECHLRCEKQAKTEVEKQRICEERCEEKRREKGVSLVFDQEEERESNPYVFKEEHFCTKLETQEGRLWVLPKFSEKSELLRGIEGFRLAILETDPQSFIIPNHKDADEIFYVASGRGTISMIFKNRRESFNIKQGDIVRVPAGTTVYMINGDNNQKLDIVKLLRPVSVPGQFEEFFGPGGENPESYYMSFSDDILEAALNTRKERLGRLFGQRRQGAIVKAGKEQIEALSQHEEGGIWPFGGQSRGPFNLLNKRPSQSNEHGQLYEANSEDYKQLKDFDVAVSYVNISSGSMQAPFYNSRATKLAVVVKGEGYFEMTCPHLSSSQSEREMDTHHHHEEEKRVSYQKVRSPLMRCTVVVVPAGHPIAVVASQDQNLEIVCFEINAEDNEKYSLAVLLVFYGGRGNIMNQMEKEAKELAFGVPAREVEEVFKSQHEDGFLGHRAKKVAPMLED